MSEIVATCPACGQKFYPKPDSALTADNKRLQKVVDQLMEVIRLAATRAGAHAPIRKGKG